MAPIFCCFQTSSGPPPAAPATAISTVLPVKEEEEEEEKEEEKGATVTRPTLARNDSFNRAIREGSRIGSDVSAAQNKHPNQCC